MGVALRGRANDAERALAMTCLARFGTLPTQGFAKEHYHCEEAVFVSACGSPCLAPFQSFS